MINRREDSIRVKHSKGPVKKKKKNLWFKEKLTRRRRIWFLICWSVVSIFRRLILYPGFVYC